MSIFHDFDATVPPFATFDFFCKMKLVSTVRHINVLSKFDYRAVLEQRRFYYCLYLGDVLRIVILSKNVKKLSYFKQPLELKAFSVLFIFFHSRRVIARKYIKLKKS